MIDIFSGLRFVKLDLHVHTPASSDFKDGNKITPADIVKIALDKRLDGLAITDHNSNEWINN